MNEALNREYTTNLLEVPKDINYYIDNDHRAARAALALDLHHEQQNFDYGYAAHDHEAEGYPETMVMELLSDLLHYCDAQKVDFDRAMAHARMNHEDEQG